jgi:osomolarity two-component system sensor histidine kinase NIK1
LHLQCPASIVKFLSFLKKPLLKWYLDNSISSQVTTPVTAQDLASALVSALKSNAVSPVSAPNDAVFDILLAEDNLINQKLAVKIPEVRPYGRDRGE